MKNLVIICCLHGNEGYGLEVCKRQSLSPFVLANKKALKEKKRFIDADLNRVFPGNNNGNHEEKTAANILKKIRDFDYVIDLHSSSNDCPMFGIITKPNEEKIEFAKRLGLKRLVIMPKSIASGKALIDFVKCGISLEVGPHNRKENIDKTLGLINNLIKQEKYNNNLDIFEVFAIIKKEQPNILIKNFDNIKKGELIAKGEDNQYANFDFTAVLVNEEAYKDVLCLAARKVAFINNKSEVLS